MMFFCTLPFHNSLTKRLANHTSRFILLSGLLFALLGCSKPQTISQLPLEVWYQGKLLDCDSFQHNQQPWNIRQFALFISDISFQSTQLAEPIKLVESQWQTAELTLLTPNLTQCGQSDSQQSVVNQSLSKANAVITFANEVELANIEQINFTVGVPFALNHLNPLVQASPLNLPSMFWSWRAGHKFFRLDLQSPQDNWVFHLGSVGCESASVMRSPQTPCVQANRLNFNLAKQQQGSKLVLHLDRLLANIELTSSHSCLFHPGQTSCATLLENLAHQGVFEWH